MGIFYNITFSVENLFTLAIIADKSCKYKIGAPWYQHIFTLNVNIAENISHFQYRFNTGVMFDCQLFRIFHDMSV